MSRWSILGGIVCCATLASCASAQGTTDCTISVNDLNFGPYVSIASNLSSTPVAVTCSAGQDYWIGLDTGTAVGATVTTRKMTGPAMATLGYQLFTDSARTTNWGATSSYVSGTGTGENQTRQIYARLTEGQIAQPGTYTDTITASITGGSTETTTFMVVAIVQPSCTVTSTDLAFGGYAGAEQTSSSQLTVTCTDTTRFEIGLNAGLNSGATVSSRAMKGPGTAVLSYGLSRDASDTLNWGNTVGTDTLTDTGTGLAGVYTVYGRIPAGQFVMPGSYGDTIVATISY